MRFFPDCQSQSFGNYGNMRIICYICSPKTSNNMSNSDDAQGNLVLKRIRGYCHKCLIDVNRDIIMDDSSKTN